MQTLPRNSTLQPRTLNKKWKVYEETVKGLTLKKLGTEIKSQTPSTALEGVLSTCTNCPSTQQGGKEGIPPLNDLTEFLFRKEGKKKFKKMAPWEKERL